MFVNLKDIIVEQAKSYDSFYLYDEEGVVKSTDALKESFPNVKFLYSIKSNPNRNVVNRIFQQGFGSDAASLGEVLLSRELGLDPDEIYYSAPGKSVGDIREALDKSIIIADSIDEIMRIDKISKELGRVTEIGVRINPDFSFTGDGGSPSKFGIDEDQIYDFLADNDCENIKVNGIHVHLRSQELDANVLEQYYEKMFALAEDFKVKTNSELAYVNMGSGIGIQYSLDDSPLDIGHLGKFINEKLHSFSADNPNTKIIIEVGRYAIGKNGYYVTKVLDRKVSHGTTFIILKNTLNGFIRPSIANLVGKYSPDENPVASEPLFTSLDAFQFLTLKGDEEREKVTLVGNLCTGIDVIANDIMMPKLECDDIVYMTNAGSYAAVLTPMQFSSQERPVELFVKMNGEVVE